MRIAAMVVGILLSIWMFLESLIVYNVADALEEDQFANAASLGFYAAILAGIAAMLVLSVPLISMVIFLLASALSFGAGAMGYGNHYVFGGVLVGLALFAFFGRRGQLRDRREKAAERARQEQRDEQLNEMMRRQVAPPGE